jgi:hypothetical protein
MSEPIEVVCQDMMCFKVDPDTLEAVTCSYYEPAAWSDPKGPQMPYSQWLYLRDKNRREPQLHAPEDK